MIAIQPKSRQLLGVNQHAYQALKASMSLNLRRQLLIAVCDDVRMQNQLATQLEQDLLQSDRTSATSSANGSNGANGTSSSTTSPSTNGSNGTSPSTASSSEPADADSVAQAPGLERLNFDSEDGNLPQQVAQWVRHTMLSEGALPKLQVLGIEQMIHQPAITQNYFLRSLEKIEALLPRLNTSLLIWVPWPWLRTIQQSSPTFWNWRNGVFEFVSDPTPTPSSRDALILDFPTPALADEGRDRPAEVAEPSSRHNGSHNGAQNGNGHTQNGNGQNGNGQNGARNGRDFSNGTFTQNGTRNGTNAAQVEARGRRPAAESGLYGESPSESFSESSGGRPSEAARDRPLNIALAPAKGEFPMPKVAEVETVARDRALTQPVSEASVAEAPAVKVAITEAPVAEVTEVTEVTIAEAPTAEIQLEPVAESVPSVAESVPSMVVAPIAVPPVPIISERIVSKDITENTTLEDTAQETAKAGSTEKSAEHNGSNPLNLPLNLIERLAQKIEARSPKADSSLADSSVTDSSDAAVTAPALEDFAEDSVSEALLPSAKTEVAEPSKTEVKTEVKAELSVDKVPAELLNDSRQEHSVDECNDSNNVSKASDFKASDSNASGAKVNDSKANDSKANDSKAKAVQAGASVNNDLNDLNDQSFQDIFSLGGLHSIVSRGINVPRPAKPVQPENVAAFDAIAHEFTEDDLAETDDWMDDDIADVALANKEFDSLGWDDFASTDEAGPDSEKLDSEKPDSEKPDSEKAEEIAAAALRADAPRQIEVKTAEERRQQAAEYFAAGLAYRARIEAGERSLAVIDPAIEAYESGLRCMLDPHPDWVTGLNDLGTLYWLKAQQQETTQQAVVFMTRSIHLYQEALSKIQPDQDGFVSELQPGIIGQLYSNMGAVYTVLATCEEPLSYLKEAADTYNRALPMVSLETHPEEYATLQNSLGSVFWKLSHYDSAAAYLHQAIAAYNEALLGYRPDQRPLDYAAVQNNLGITYWSLAKQERPEFLLKHAIAAYRDALNYRTADVDPSACAISYNNLALAYWDLAKHTQGDIAQKSRYQKNAVTAFEAALNISKLSGALNAMDSAAIYHCLGDVHAQMIETAPSRSDIAQSLQKSLYSYIKAIEGLPADAPAYPGRFTAVVANLKLHYDKLGLEGQQAALNRVPPALLPQVMMAL